VYCSLRDQFTLAPKKAEKVIYLAEMTIIADGWTHRGYLRATRYAPEQPVGLSACDFCEKFAKGAGGTRSRSA